MPVQIKGVGSISGLDQGIVVGIVTSSTQINVGSNIKFGSAGIATASNFKTGSSNLHSTGLTVGNNFLHTTGINVGTGATIHVPASNTLTFGTNSNERVRIDSSGRVLIGTTNEGEANADDLTIATTGHTGITLRSGTSNYGQIFFSDAESGTGEYEGIIAYDHSNNSMVFHTTRAERLRITSAGDVGIGTATPVVASGYGNLSLAGSTGGQLEFKRVSNDTRHYIWGHTDLNIGGGYHNGSSSNIIFRVNGATERLRIMSNGDIGINTSVINRADTGRPCIQFDYGGNDGSEGLEIRLSNSTLNGNAATDNAAITYIGQNLGITNRENGVITFRNNGSERLRINNLGNVSIGNNPTVHTDTIFHVEKSSGETNVKFEGNDTMGARLSLHNNNTSASANNQLAFCDAGGQSTSTIIGYNTDQTNNLGELVFATRSAQGTPPQERLRITSQGAFHLFDGTYNYIESADYRIYSNTSLSDGYTGAIRTVARYNSNTSLLSHSQTGGTGGASRWTFGKNCYCLLTVSQDVDGNTDSGYWWMGPKINGSFIGRHLVRKTTEWDMMTWQQSFQVSENDWLEIAWGSTSGLTAVDGTDWSHYCFMIWENK